MLRHYEGERSDLIIARCVPYTLIIFSFRIQVIVSGQMDYADPFVQQQVENLTQTFENTSYISNPLYTESWLRSFLQYAERNEDYLNISLKSEDGFISALKEVMNQHTHIKILSF